MQKSAYNIQEMNKLIQATKAIADENRALMLHLIMQRECCVCEVMAVLSISQTRASRNLGILHKAGFLKVRKQGLWVHYSIDKKSMSDYLLSLLDSVEQGLSKNKQAQMDIRKLKQTDGAKICCGK